MKAVGIGGESQHSLDQVKMGVMQCVGCKTEFQSHLSNEYTSTACRNLGLHLEPSYCHPCYNRIAASCCRRVMGDWTSFTEALCLEAGYTTKLSKVYSVLPHEHAEQYFKSLAKVVTAEYTTLLSYTHRYHTSLTHVHIPHFSLTRVHTSLLLYTHTYLTSLIH